MIHDEICTYEVAKLAKEKGFQLDCIGYYDFAGEFHFNYESAISNKERLFCHNKYNNIWYRDLTDAPTQSLLQRWLREEKGIHIVIESEPTTTTSSNMLFQWIINYNSDGEYYDCYNDIRAYPSYEKTLESALKFALENLV